jgi:hypothetical protein
MRIDHVVVHIDNDPVRLHAMKRNLTDLGYPYDHEGGKGNNDFRSTNINIGSEYIEVVRLQKPNVQSWMPIWSRNYDNGQRGVYCLFLEVEDVERTAVALMKSGIRARGPAAITYPGVFGLLRLEAPYLIYYLPTFPDTLLHLALMQYKPKGRESTQASLVPNSSQYGINGIRRAEFELPNLDESMDMLQKLFPDLHLEGGDWVSQLDKQRIAFRQSAEKATRLKLFAVTSQRSRIGRQFKIDNVEVQTIGG